MTNYKYGYVQTYFVVAMPINNNGQGPAEPDETHHIEYEIWDDAFNTIETFDNEHSANDRCFKLNRGFLS